MSSLRESVLYGIIRLTRVLAMIPLITWWLLAFNLFKNYQIRTPSQPMKAVKIKTYTWTKDSNKLFDYECSNLSQSGIFSKESLLVTRKDSEIFFHDISQGETPVNHTPLCTIKKNPDGRFFVSSADAAAPLKLVIRSLNSKDKQNGYEIKVGDKIQIGRVEYFVREMKDGKNNLYKVDNGTLKQSKEMEIEGPYEAKICRICLEEEVKDDTDPENAFISPCLCKGSSKYVHLGCLKNWIKSKKQPHKQVTDSRNHSQQSSFMSLFRSLFGFYNQAIPRTLPSNLNFNAINSVEPTMGLTPRPLYPFNIHTGMNPQMIPNPSRTSFDEATPLGPSQFNIRSAIYATPLMNVPPQLHPDVVTSTTQIPVSIRHREHHQHAPRNFESLAVENNCFSNFSCDVCKEILPFTVKVENKFETETANISRPENTPYLLLERLSLEKGPKVFSIVKGLENTDVRLGRGHTCDIPISDISVSRWHAFIRYQNGKFIIIDNNSKYGTLIKLEEPIEIKDEKLGFQSGRTLIIVSTRTHDPMMKFTNKLDTMQIEESKLCHHIPKACPKVYNPNLYKRIQAQIKLPTARQFKDSDIHRAVPEIEEIPSNRVPQLNSRSKKISKNSKRT